MYSILLALYILFLMFSLESWRCCWLYSFIVKYDLFNKSNIFYIVGVSLRHVRNNITFLSLFYSFWLEMSFWSVLLVSILIILVGGVLYVGTYNHNLSFTVNLFSFFSWFWLKILLGKYVCVYWFHSRGKEEDKKRAIFLRDLIIPPRTKLPKSISCFVTSSVEKGIVTDVISVQVRDGAMIDLYICRILSGCFI